MKKRGGFIFFAAIFLIILAGLISALAVEDNIPIQIQVTNSTGGIVTGTYSFKIDISDSNTCTPILYTYTYSGTTDSRGVVSFNLAGVNVSFGEQYYFCYYRDNVLKETIKAARVPYSFFAKNVSSSGIIVESNLNLGNYNLTTNYICGTSGNCYSLTDLNSSSGSSSGTNYWSSNGSNIYNTTAYVGIGISSPVSTLQVAGTGAWIQGSSGGLASSAGQGIRIAMGGTSFANIFAYDYGSGTALNLVLQSPGGKVGIGTASPTELLELSSASAGISINSSAGTNPIIRFKENGVERGAIYYYANGDDNFHVRSGVGTNLSFDTNGSTTSRMFIDTNGNVGIGTTSPSQKLEVTGGNISIDEGQSFMIRRGAFYNKILWQDLGDSLHIAQPNDNRIAFETNGLEKATILSSGNVGIGTSTPSNKLDVRGTINASGMIYYNNGTPVTGGSSGNPFDQVLNTTSSPTFANLNIGPQDTVNEGGQINWVPANGGFAQWFQDIYQNRMRLWANTTGSGDTLALFNTGDVGIAGSAIYAKFNGNVGIGTTSPSNTLDVRGSGNFSGTVYVNNKTNLLPPTCSGNDKLTFDGTSFSCSADVLGTSGSGIIASGNNVNGSYIKFADGTMIEWGNITQTTSSSSSNQFGTTSGTSYSVSNLITYPVAFVSTPTVVGSVSDPSFGSAWVTLLGVTPSNFISQLWSALNGLGRTVGWTAIGRWTTLTNITQNTTSWAVNGNGDTVLFDTTKKVGIGTNNPSSKLEVVGNVNITGNLTLGIGKIMYNTSANNYIYYNTTDWATFGTGTSSSSGIPAGMIAPFNSASCPTGWILADGTSGTPDLRGIFIRGSGASGSMKYANGSYYNIGQGTYGNDSFQNHTHVVVPWSGSGPQATRVFSENTGGVSGGTNILATGTSGSEWAEFRATGDYHPNNPTTRAGVENRPAYYATVYCVKTAEDTPVSNTIWGTSGNTILVNNQSMNLSLSNTSTIYYAPNSSEPSAGTLHFKYTQNILNGATIGVGQNVSVDFSPYVPVGTTAILAEVYMNPGAPCYVTFGANKGDRDTISLNYGSAYVSNHVTFRLNSTRGAYVMNPSSGYSTGATFYLNLNGYYI